MNSSLPRLALLALTCSAWISAPLLNHAAEATWVPTAAGTTYNWTDPANWSTGTAPNGAGDVANITNNIAGTQSVLLASGATTLGTLNISDTDFTHGFSVGGSGSLTFQGATTGAATAINVNGGSGTYVTQILAPVFVGTNSPLTITNTGTVTGGATNFTGVISGSSAITKEGNRGITLSGNNTYSGALTINTGTVTITGNNAHIDSTNITVSGNAVPGFGANTEGAMLILGSNSGGSTESGATGGWINDSATVTLNGGVFRLNGSQATTTQETFATLIANEGSSRLDVGGNNTAGRTTTLNLTDLTRTAGATLLLRRGANGTNRVFITNGSKAQLGMVGGDGANGTTTINIIPGMNGGTNISNDASDLVTYNATDGLRQLVTGEYVTTALDLSANPFENFRVGLLSLTSDKTINALVYNGTNTNIGSGRTLTITSGTVIFTGATASIGTDATAGTLNFGAAEGIVFANTGNLNTIVSVINGSNGFTKGGTGTLTLSGANTYTGITTVAGGILKAGAANVFNNTALSLSNTNGNNLNGGTANVVTTLDLNNFDQRVASLAGGGVFGGNITLGSAKLTSGVANSATSTTYGGVISGTGQFEKTNASRQVLTGANTFSGGTTLNGGELRIANTTGSATGSGTVSVDGTVAGTTLSGTGFATGATTVGNGGFIAAGLNTAAAGTARTNFGFAGTLGLGTTDGLTLNTAKLDFDLANVTTVGGGVNDLITTSTLALGNASLVFNFNALNGTFATGTAYTLIDASLVSGFLAGNITTTFVGGLTGYTATYSVANQDLLVTFSASQVPEPGTFALMLGGACLLLVGGRRTRKSA
jgi:autotransporter-associated beta strand protein